MSEMPSSAASERMSYSLPVEATSSIDSGGIKFNETHFDVNGDIVGCVDLQSNSTKPTAICDKNKKKDNESIENSFAQQFVESRNEILNNSTEFDDNGHCSGILGHNGAFLDAKVVLADCQFFNSKHRVLTAKIFIFKFRLGDELVAICQFLSANGGTGTIGLDAIEYRSECHVLG